MRHVCRDFLDGWHRRSSAEPCLQMPARDREASRLPEMYPRCTRVLHGQATRNPHLQAFRRSPLADSNRRPLPSAATGLLETFNGKEGAP
jgi:hypothetical protein